MSTIGRVAWLVPASFFTLPTKCGLTSQSAPSFHATCSALTGWPTNRYSISLRTSMNSASGFFCRNSCACLGSTCSIDPHYPLSYEWIRLTRWPAPGWARTMSRVTTEVKTTTCYMCACRCGIRVHLHQGKIRYIDGNPAHPLNKGVICAKGASGIMKQVSPARLTRPLRRKAGSERGAGDFEPISWDEALGLLETRLRRIRAEDPRKFAFFTGRDQMQALTQLFARQFGTPNYAAHGGFCSVNMAAGMIYTIGGSFWEFGGPDLDRAKLFVMIGTAEDHHSNPLKIAISKFKRAGGRFISVNPVRTGYSAIADEWIPIRPGTDGALMMALCSELVRQDLCDREFLAQYTNAGYLVNDEGLFACAKAEDKTNPFRRHDQLWWDRASGRAVENHAAGADPALEGEFSLANGARVKPAFQLLRDRLEDCTPEWAAEITGIAADKIRSLAREMGRTAREQS